MGRISKNVTKKYKEVRLLRGKQLENDSKTISASEINRFTYCNYQWYYERLYGRKKLRELKADRNKELGYKGDGNSNFKRGVRFHNDSYAKMRVQNTLLKLFIIAVLVMAIVVYFKVV